MKFFFGHFCGFGALGVGWGGFKCVSICGSCIHISATFGLTLGWASSSIQLE